MLIVAFLASFYALQLQLFRLVGSYAAHIHVLRCANATLSHSVHPSHATSDHTRAFSNRPLVGVGEYNILGSLFINTDCRVDDVHLVYTLAKKRTGAATS